MENEEYYIEDNDLIELLKGVLGDNISDDDIEKILNASADGELSEGDFDNLVDEILAKSKSNQSSLGAELPADSDDDLEKEFVYITSSPDRCPICGGSLLDSTYCPICNLKFSFDSQDK